MYLREQARSAIVHAQRMRATLRAECARRGVDCPPMVLEPYDKMEAKAKAKLEEWG